MRDANLVADPAQQRQQGCVRGALRHPVEQIVHSGVLDRQRQVRGTEREPQLHGRDHRDEQLAVGPREDGACRPVVGPASHRARDAHQVVRRIGREDEPSPGRRSGDDAFREPLRVVLHEPDRARHDRSRAAVVGRQIDPAEPGQRAREAEHASHVGETPAIDRLVVVADEEDAVRRLREQQCELQLRPVEVLCLVDQQLGAAGTPARQGRSVVLEQPQRTDHEVVEVDAAARGDRPLVGDEGARHRSGCRVACHLVGRDPDVELEPREREVEATAVRERDPGKQLAEQCVPIHEGLHVHTGLCEHLPPERVECPNPDRARGDAERLERPVQPGRQLLRGPLVEGDDGHGSGSEPAVHEPRNSCDEGRRLAAAGRRDAEHGSRRGGRGRALVRRQPFQARGHRRVAHRPECGRRRSSVVHRWVTGGSPGVDRRIPRSLPVHRRTGTVASRGSSGDGVTPGWVRMAPRWLRWALAPPSHRRTYRMSIGSRRRRGVALVLGAALTLGIALPTTAGRTPPAGPLLDIQLLAFNDYHGHLERTTPGTVGTTPAGGAEFLAAHLAKLREGHRNSLTVAAGDLIGGSPFLSGLFRDEPSVESLNAMGLDVSSVGNHEFDDGVTELLRMQKGGCHPVDGCYFPDEPYAGADFPWLAANVVNDKTGKTVLPPYWIKKFQGAKIAFIGMTLEGTPALVGPSGIEGYSFKNEAETANALVPILKRKGVEAIVVLLHEGLDQTGSYDECVGASGPVLQIQAALHPEIDLMITGHTHRPYNCVLTDPAGKARRVTSAFSFGKIISEINLRIDRRTGDVRRDLVEATNHVVDQTLVPDPAQTAIIDKYKAVSSVIGSRPVGQITADIRRGDDQRQRGAAPSSRPPAT